MKYRLMRQDENGNISEVQIQGSHKALEVAKDILESHSHKQIFWIEGGPAKPGIYKHYKDSLYEVMGVAVDVKTKERKVFYRALYGDYGLWTRSEDEFIGRVDKDGYKGLRFTLVKEF